MTERTCRAVVRLSTWIVPRSGRTRWYEEWDGEIAHAWRPETRPLSGRRRAALTLRVLGGLRHALAIRLGTWQLTGALRDLTGALRFARRQPAVVAIAVLTLALGVGANTTIFSVVNAVFLRPLPLGHAAELVSVVTTDVAYQNRLLPVSYLNFRDYRESHAFADLAAEVHLDLNLGDGAGPPERLASALVTANYFDVLGVMPVVGRTFQPSEDAPLDAHPVLVISATLWHRRFGGDAQIAGRTVTINGLPYTIVGVAAEGFRGPTLLSALDVWVPMTQRRGIVGYLDRWFDARQALMCAVYGRLGAPGDLTHATAVMRVVSDRLADQFPQQNHARRAVLIPLAQAGLNPNQRGQIVRVSWFLSIVAGLVLVLGCTNVANLLLLRALGRRREIAIRIATGASRLRLIRQLLGESLLLSAAGGGVGLLIAIGGRRLLWAFKPPAVPDTFTVPFDARVLTYTIGLALGTGLIFGLVPALQASKADVVTSLKGTHAGAGAPRTLTWKNALVVVQIALSVMLLVGTGLVLRSLDHAERIDPGVAANHLVVVNMNPDGIGYDRPRAVAFFRRVIETVEAVPGVTSAAFTFNRPLAPALSALFYLEGKEVPSPRDGAPIATNAADPHFFATAGIALEAGRNFTAADTETSEPSIIINKSVQARFFRPDESPVGQRMRFVDVPTAFRIVGVVSDSTYGAIGEETPNYFYYPFEQAYGAGEVTLFIRTAADPQRVLDPVRRAIQALDGHLPLYNLGVVSDLVTRSLWAPRVASALLALFGLVGLVLAAVGTYGVMSFHVDQSRREIGIRLALGEGQRAVLGTVVGRAMRLVAVGLAIGLAVSAATTHLIASFLYNLSATDAWTFASAPVLLALTALGATLMPARRATTVDPLQVLRSE
jgi:predicted permease